MEPITIATALVPILTQVTSHLVNSFANRSSESNRNQVGLSELEHRYLTEKNNREAIALELQREQLRLQSQFHSEQIALGLKKIQADY